MLGSLVAPQSLNRYAFVVNNPLRWVDPLGLFPTPADGDGGFDDLREGGGAGGLGLRKPGSSLFGKRPPGRTQTIDGFRRIMSDRFSGDTVNLRRVNELANKALQGGKAGKAAYAEIKAQMRMIDKFGPKAIRGLGGEGQPDFFVKRGLNSPDAKWIEVKTGNVDAAKLRMYQDGWGPGELAYGSQRLGGANRDALARIGMLDRWWWIGE